MKIGLYGGTFDPIHFAHLIIAQHLKEELQLDKIIFIPSSISPHKRVFSSAEFRFEMVSLAIADNPDFECSNIEILRGGTSYSVDTIAALKDKLGVSRKDLFYIMGTDNFIYFDKWKEHERIMSLCQIAVFPRNQIDFDSAPIACRQNAHYFETAPIIDISSTTIRDLVARKRSIRYVVPTCVSQFIDANNMYGKAV